jgi:hypothetical protein
VTNSPSVGDVAESSRNTSPSRTRSNAQDVKQSTSTFKDGLTKLVNNPKVFAGQECFVGQMLANLITPEESDYYFILRSQIKEFVMLIWFAFAKPKVTK